MAMVSEETDMSSTDQKSTAAAGTLNRPGSAGSSRGGANYALQVALQTMKERCQQLQRRLTTVEDENIALRRLVARSGSDDRDAGTPEQLREQVAVLSLQKAQLSQQMQMVAAENRQLWLRLSRLYQANQSLGSHLSRISDTLRQHTASSTPQSTSLAQENEESLEEISLKLANSIMQEKIDLEQQCAQMAELQEGSASIDLQTLAAEGDGAEVLAAHYARLKEVRDLLLNHQTALRAGIEALHKVKTVKTAPFEDARSSPVDNSLPSTSVDVEADEISEEECHQLTELRNWGSSPPEWTCPMCGNFFPTASNSFEKFHSHVMSHFTTDSEDDNFVDTFDFVN